MKFQIEEKENGLDISIAELEGKRNELIQAFGECREGRCSCPTEEYKKMDSLEIDHDDQNIRLHLKAISGSKLERSEINRCLEYTSVRINQQVILEKFSKYG